MKKRTKILATVGPASDSLEKLEALIKAGVNVFRMNFSHGTHSYHEEVLKNIRKAMHNTGLIVGVLQDISGPKIRIGKLEEDFNLLPGDILEFTSETIVGKKLSDSKYSLCINQSDILGMMQEGEFIYLYDGIIRSKVLKVSPDKVIAEVQNSGKLSSNKGVNFPNTRIGVDVLTQKDRDDMLWGIKHGVDFMAISFVQNAHDMMMAREILEKNDGQQQLFAKIEKFDAVENIDEILEVSDGLMVARGDLGIEVPYYQVPSIQKMLISKANEASKPVITATQMLLSMTANETATRAEISDVANAVLDGTDVVMLSEESAVGAHPILAVETMVNTIQETEKLYPFYKFSRYKHCDQMDMIDESAVRMGESLGADGILAMTSSGQSAKKIARYRPEFPIYAVMHDERIARMLTIVWGVVPAFLVKKNKLDMMLAEVVQRGIERDVLTKSNRYILTAGDPVGIPGTTNNIRILQSHELEYFENYTLPTSKKKAVASESATLF